METDPNFRRNVMTLMALGLVLFSTSVSLWLYYAPPTLFAQSALGYGVAIGFSALLAALIARRTPPEKRGPRFALSTGGYPWPMRLMFYGGVVGMVLSGAFNLYELYLGVDAWFSIFPYFWGSLMVMLTGNVWKARIDRDKIAGRRP